MSTSWATGSAVSWRRWTSNLSDTPGWGLATRCSARNHLGDVDDVLLLGHLDTGAPMSEWAPYRADDRRIFGTGVAESKGGIAVALAALRGLRHIRRLRQLRVAILLTSDGAGTGAGGAQLVVAAAARARHVIGLKAGGPNGALISARAGEHRYHIESAFRRRGRAVSVSAEQIVRHFANRILALQELSRDPPADAADGDAVSAETIPTAGVHAHVTRLRFDAGGARLPWRAEVALTVRFTDPEAGPALDQQVERGGERENHGRRADADGHAAGSARAASDRARSGAAGDHPARRPGFEPSGAVGLPLGGGRHRLRSRQRGPGRRSGARGRRRPDRTTSTSCATPSWTARRCSR